MGRLTSFFESRSGLARDLYLTISCLDGALRAMHIPNLISILGKSGSVYSIRYKFSSPHKVAMGGPGPTARHLRDVTEKNVQT